MGLSEDLQNQIKSLQEEKEKLQQVLKEVEEKMNGVNASGLQTTLSQEIEKMQTPLTVIKQANYTYASIFATKIDDLLKALNRVDKDISNRNKAIDIAKQNIQNKIKELENKITENNRLKDLEEAKEKAKKEQQNQNNN